MSLLTVNSLQVKYGAVQAVRGIDFEVEEGEIVGLLGANGAGKTSTLNAIAGLVPTSDGTVTFDGRDITNLPTEKLVNTGLTLSPEGRRIFGTLSVGDNLKLGAYGVSDNAEIEKSYARVYDLFPILLERRAQYAGTLSGGQQQMLAVGRALMSNPRVLLLDEPSLGLAPIIVDQIFDLISTLRSQGVTIVLVEQNAAMTLDIADRAYLLSNGTVALSGTAKEIAESSAVKDAYFGAA